MLRDTCCFSALSLAPICNLRCVYAPRFHLQAAAEQKAKFEEDVSRHVVVQNMYAIQLKLKQYCDVHNPEVVARLTRNAMLFCLPVRDEHNEEYGDFVFPKSRKDLISRFDAPMANSVACQKKATTKSALPVGTDSAKKRRKKNNGESDLAAAVRAEEALPLETRLTSTDGERECTITDAILFAVFGPVEGLPKKDINWVQVDASLTRLVAFLFHGGCTHNGEWCEELRKVVEADEQPTTY